MLEGLYSAAAGMAAQQTQLDAISNDLANLNTTGYKSDRVAFNDLLYNQVDIAGSETTTGSGANAEFFGRSETQGTLHETGNPLDLAIEGSGYFQVRLASGETALTRDGTFSVDANGEIVDAAGNRLVPPIKLPAGTEESELRIASDGTVSANNKTLGRIALLDVPSPEHMTSLGGNLLTANSESGAAKAASGHIHQGAVEESNVDLGRDMSTMVTTQRAFQMDSSAIQNEDQMMTIANQLRPQ